MNNITKIVAYSGVLLSSFPSESKICCRNSLDQEICTFVISFKI